MSKIKIQHVRDCDCEAWPFCDHASNSEVKKQTAKRLWYKGCTMQDLADNGLTITEYLNLTAPLAKSFGLPKPQRNSNMTVNP